MYTTIYKHIYGKDSIDEEITFVPKSYYGLIPDPINFCTPLSKSEEFLLFITANQMRETTVPEFEEFKKSYRKSMMFVPWSIAFVVTAFAVVVARKPYDRALSKELEYFTKHSHEISMLEKDLKKGITDRLDKSYFKNFVKDRQRFPNLDYKEWITDRIKGKRAGFLFATFVVTAVTFKDIGAQNLRTDMYEAFKSPRLHRMIAVYKDTYKHSAPRAMFYKNERAGSDKPADKQP